jgi:uncharacterized RDD family membrane protein YckC
MDSWNQSNGRNETMHFFSEAANQSFAKILSGQILAIGFLITAFTERKRALHDLLAKTLIVNNKI